MKRAVVFAGVISLAFLVLGCSLALFETLDNPADPKADSYQGYHLVRDPDNLILHIEDGAVLSSAQLVFSETAGATRYEVQVSSSEDFNGPLAAQHFTPTTSVASDLPKTLDPWYWRVRAEVDGEWRSWSSVGTFTVIHPNTVYFDSQGGSYASPKTISAGTEYGTLPVVYKADKAFVGWRTEPEGRGAEITANTWVTTGKSHTLYAFWKPLYHIRDIGPAGGYVFYDKGSYEGGWRYLEAAPEGWNGTKNDPIYIFGYYRKYDTNRIVGTYTGIGNGKENTAALVAAMGSRAYDSASGYTRSQYAPRVADTLSLRLRGGSTYRDWFLPSMWELHEMWYVLHQGEHRLGGFSNDYYWSSSEHDELQVRIYDFKEGSPDWIAHRWGNNRVRPIRAF